MSESLNIKEVIEDVSSAIEEEFTKTLLPFRPVKCKQSDIDGKIQSINGYVYFTLDTQKIYYGTGTDFLPMGGSSGIYYTNKTFGEEDVDDTSFSLEHFEDGALPNNVNDLIINVGANESRNGFYQVVEILPEESMVITRYLPVGGGGGGGSSSGGSSAGQVKIAYVSPQTDAVLAGKDYYINFTVEATDANGDLVASGGTATWTVNGKKYPGGTLLNGVENINSFNIGPYLSSAVDSNTVKLTVSVDTGGSVNNIVTKTWSIIAINLTLDWPWEYSSSAYISEDLFTLFWTPKGNVDASAYIWFDNDFLNTKIVDLPAKKLGSQQSTTFSSLGYGVHAAHIQLMTTVNGEVYRTDTTTRTLTFIKGGTTPLLTVPFYKTEATQYDTIEIPFLVYDAANAYSTVEFLINENVVSTDAYDRELHSIPYTLGVSGTVQLGLRIKDTTIAWSTTLQVNPLALDVSEVANPDFKLKASDLVANDGLLAMQTAGLITFSENFDWVNGGLKTEIDEKGHLRKYICIKNGTYITINYNLFDDSGVQYGKNFKVIFKTSNCYDYNAAVMSCYDTSAGRGIGIQINAQNAIFSSNETDIVTQYCEDSYIELEAEIWPKSAASNPDNFMMFWVDGIPSAVKAYGSNASFNQATHRPITIGSNNCDIQLYLVKVYEKKLSEEQHLNNFIADAPNVEEMLARYERNDILDARNEISYSKLVEKNPNCRAHVYTIPRMTVNKKDKVTGCEYEQYYKDGDTPILSAQNVTVKVQGTSSAAYGVAAFNIDSKFEDGFIDKEGNAMQGWSMSNTAIPVNYFCTKVNVASCENTNNALNQEWYNEFQPYWDAHRRKTYMADPTKRYRDTMEFTMGVMFVEDHNEKTQFSSHDDYPYANMFSDINGYVANPYPKQYAICNMGNSKDNVSVFHDNDNPRACCVEVCDNQNEEHWMTKPVDISTFSLEEPYYEFRYPDGNDEATTAQKQAWVDFVNWMCASNPAAATNKELDAPVSFPAYTFKGFDPPGFEGKPSPTGVSLKGLTISEYSTFKSIEEPVLDSEGNYQYDDEGNVIVRIVTREVPYTHDTYEYRMAKMLSECEDHLVMDSVIYHYLFIERHTMVDNVAKNTFWSSEDLIHWDLTKDYDNDTADGNNNTGYLVYTYGIECLDKETDNKFVFNAKDSVWLQFAHGLLEAQKHLYTQLASYAGASGKYPGAWDEEAYLKAHESWQGSIPERCWIYDYFRKYIRPRRLGLDNEVYLKRLEGGKKTHQRKQYETYHRYYLDSKYQAGKALASKIDLRSNSAGETGFPEDYVTPVTTYIDCYPFVSIGGRTYHKRIKRGEVCNIPVGKLVSNANDATTYYYCGSMIQTIGNLQYLYPSYATLDAATKLRRLELGSDEDNYRNDNLKSADFSSNIMLENAFIQNSGNRSESNLSSLDLSKLVSLKELRINGSTYAGVILPPAGALETAYINGVSTLEMSNLEKLETLVFDNDIYTNLMTLKVINCPTVNTYDLVMNSNLTSYYLTNVNWNITSLSDITVDENNNLISIAVLEHLLRKAIEEGQTTCRPIDGQTTQTALSGTITVQVPGVSVDEYALYEKYHKTYPNLNIICDADVMNVNKAISITFYKSDEDNSEILYHVLAPQNNSMNLDYLTSLDGPAGQKMGEPSKNQTITDSYKWNINEEDLDWEIIITTASGETRTTKVTHVVMGTMIPQNVVSYDCKPIFQTTTRRYPVVLRDVDETEVQHDYVAGVEYGTTITLPAYMYREHSTPGMRWGFKGWISPTDHLSGTKNPTLITDLTNNSVLVNENFYAYAFYEEEDVTKTPSPLEYFQGDTASPSEYNSSNSYYTIRIKDKYASILQGPITFPSTDKNGKIFTAIGATSKGTRSTGITEIYFLEDAKYKVVQTGAFSGKAYENLTKIMLPDTITGFDKQAFQDAYNLETIHWPSSLEYLGSQCFYGSDKTMKINLHDGDLPDSVKYIGSSCFWRGGSNITISTLPKSLKALMSFTFYNCPNLAISILGGNGSETESQLESIDTGCFYGSGANNVNLTSVEIKKTVRVLLPNVNITNIASADKAPEDLSKLTNGILYNYGSSNLTEIHMAHNYDEYTWGSDDDDQVLAASYKTLCENLIRPKVKVNWNTVLQEG